MKHHRFAACVLASAIVGIGAPAAYGQVPHDPVLVNTAAAIRATAPTPDREMRDAKVAESDRVEQIWKGVGVAVYLTVVHDAEVAAQRSMATSTTRPTSRAISVGADTGRHYSCPQYASGDNPSGDFAVPCYIVGRESHGSYTADNPRSSAYGAYQILHLPPGTPPAEQDRIARGMALCNWNPPNYCAGG